MSQILTGEPEVLWEPNRRGTQQSWVWGEPPAGLRTRVREIPLAPAKNSLL